MSNKRYTDLPAASALDPAALFAIYALGTTCSQIPVSAMGASGSVLGFVQLAGALGGSASAPTALGYANAAALAADLALKVATTRQVNGHALSADVTVTKADIGLGSVENTALSTWAGSANLTTHGTISSGNHANTALKVLDTSATHNLAFVPGSALTLDRTLTFITGDASRTLTMSADATISGTNTGDQTIALTGDVTGTGTGSFAATIAAGAVTLAKMANMATASLLGRNTAGTGSPEVLAPSTVKTILSLDQVNNTSDATKFANTPLTGVPTAPTAAVDTNTTQLATTAFVIAQASAVGDGTPAMDGTASRGTSTHWTRADHVHPTDTSRAPLDSPAFTTKMTVPVYAAGAQPAAANGLVGYNTTTGRYEFGVGAAYKNHVRLDGDTMTGLLVLSADPSAALGAATKQYADAKVQNSLAASTTVAPSATSVNTALAGKVDALAASNIATGAVTITRATHLNRPLDCPGTTTATFAATATSGALQGDAFECEVGLAGSFTATGAITAPTGYKLTAGPKEVFTARYDAASDAFVSTTVNPSAAGGTWGSITGTLSSQTDLQTALNAKADVRSPVTISASTHLTVAAHADRPLLINGTGIVLTIDNDVTSGASAAETFYAIPIGTSTFTMAAGTATFSTTAGTSLDSTTSTAGVVAVERTSTDTYRALQPVASVASTASTTAMARSGYGVYSPVGLGSTTFNTVGFGIPTAIDSSTTTTASTADGSGNYGSFIRLGYQSAAAAVNRVAGWYGLVTNMRNGDTSDQNGRFPLVCTGGIRDAQTSCTFAMGIANAAPPSLTTAQPSTLINCIFVGADTTDTNFQVMCNDGAGTCTKVDTGIAVGQWKLLEVTIDKNSAGSSYTVTVSLRDSATTFTTTLSTNTPVLNTYQPFIARSSMANAATVAVDVGQWFMGKLS